MNIPTRFRICQGLLFSSSRYMIEPIATSSSGAPNSSGEGPVRPYEAILIC